MKFHPDTELLIKYASGQLDACLSLAVALHQQECTQCQQKITELESIGGQTLDSSVSLANKTDVDTSIDLSFDKLMQSIQSSPEQNQKTYPDVALAQFDLAIFKKLKKNQFQNMPWKKITTSIQQAPIAMNDPQYEVSLLKIAPNTKVPKHTHEGNEYTLVLQGDFSDKNGRYNKHAFIAQDQTHEHQPIAGKQGCICLTITDAPLKYTGAFGSILNWFTRTG